MSTRIRGRLGAGRRPLRAAAVGVAAGVIAIGAIAGIAGQATAKSSVLKVKGHYRSQLAQGPDCQAATGSALPAGSTGGRSAVLHRWHQQHHADGAGGRDAHRCGHDDPHQARQPDFAHQQAVYNVTPTGRGEFSWILRITGGTGRFAGATGYLAGAGNTPPSTGRSTSTYFGEITLAR